MRQPFRNQVELLLRCLPHVDAEGCFALKGGTALNLFLLEMPRLSVDVDLAYLPYADRETSLAEMSSALRRIETGITRTIPGASVQASTAAGENVAKLVVHRRDVHVKIEPNPVLRGSVFEPVTMDLCAAAQERFELFATARVLSKADLYGSKICAALDRQHPRDLFDVKVLLDEDGFDEDVRRAFVVYLASHSRPMHEILSPNRKDIASIYANSFVGMVDEPPPLEELEQTREDLVNTIATGLTAAERDFLLAIKRGEPQWDLLGLPNLERLPGLQWKVRNVLRMAPGKRAAAVEALKKVLE